MNPTQKLLISVVGPTAIGKTALAISIAQAFNTEIISADSRQFYKEMRIGTAVPSEEELRTVPHHFIQSRSIFEAYSVGDFERDAIEKITELFKKHDVVVLAGGSGLYVDAVVRGLDDFPDVAPEIRQQLQKELDDHGIEFLQKELKKVDPESFDFIDLRNKQRLIRALEIYRASGKTYASLRMGKVAKRAFTALYIGLTADRGVVYDRINKRVDLMIANGLLSEVAALVPHKELNALQTVGYKELFAYLEGQISKEQAISEIKKNSRRFAKRQGTWYRSQDHINWFDFETATSEIIAFIKQKKGL